MMLFNPLFLQVINNPEALSAAKPQKLNGSNYLFSDIIKIAVEKNELDSPANSLKTFNINSSLGLSGLQGNPAESKSLQDAGGSSPELTLLQLLNNIIPQKITLNNPAALESASVNGNGANTLLLNEGEVKDLISRLVNDSFKGKIGVIPQKSAGNSGSAEIIKSIDNTAITPSALLDLLKNGNTVSLENSSIQKDQGLLISLVETKATEKSEVQLLSGEKLKTIDELSAPENMLADASVLSLKVSPLIAGASLSLAIENQEQMAPAETVNQNNTAPIYQMELSFISKYDMNNNEWDFQIDPLDAAVEAIKQTENSGIQLPQSAAESAGNATALNSMTQSGISALETMLNMKGIKLPTAVDTVAKEVSNSESMASENIKSGTPDITAVKQPVNPDIAAPDLVITQQAAATEEPATILTKATSKTTEENNKANSKISELKNIISEAGLKEPVIIDAKVKGNNSPDIKTVINSTQAKAETIESDSEYVSTGNKTAAAKNSETKNSETLKPETILSESLKENVTANSAESSKQKLSESKPGINGSSLKDSGNPDAAQKELIAETKPQADSEPVTEVQNSTLKSDSKANKTSRLLQDINLTIKPVKLQKETKSSRIQKDIETVSAKSTSIKNETAANIKLNAGADETGTFKAAFTEQKIKAAAGDEKINSKPVIEANVLANKNIIQSPDNPAETKVTLKQEAGTEKQNPAADTSEENTTSSDKEHGQVVQEQSASQDKSEFKARLQDTHPVGSEIHKTAEASIKAKPFAEAAAPHNPERIIKAAEVMKEISKFIEMNDKHSLTIKIDPESMGSVKIAVDIIDKMVHANIEVQNEAARKLVENNINQLYNSLSQSGVQVSSVNISLASYDQKNNKGFVNKKKSFNHNGEEGIDEQAIDEGKKMGYNTYEYLI